MSTRSDRQTGQRGRREEPDSNLLHEDASECCGNRYAIDSLWCCKLKQLSRAQRYETHLLIVRISGGFKHGKVSIYSRRIRIALQYMPIDDTTTDFFFCILGN